MAPVVAASQHHAHAAAPLETRPTRSPYVATGLGDRRSAPAHIYMDGRRVGEIVVGHMAKEAHRPHAGTSTFDPTMAPAPVGLGYHP